MSFLGHVMLGFLRPRNVHSSHKLKSFFFFFSFLEGCSTTLNETFGQIEFSTTSYYDVRCNWKIHSAGISEAVVFISVQELNLYYCRYSELRGCLCKNRPLILLGIFVFLISWDFEALT